MSARVEEDLIGVCSTRGIEWYRSRSIRIAIEVSRKKKAAISPGTSGCPLESGRASLQSALLGVMNIVNLDGSACPSLKVDNIQ